MLKDLSGKKIMLGVINLGDQIVERPEQVAERIRTGLKYVSPDRLIPAPDCGMKYLAREVAFGKLKALADGAAIVRKELVVEPSAAVRRSPDASAASIRGRGATVLPVCGSNRRVRVISAARQNGLPNSPTSPPAILRQHTLAHIAMRSDDVRRKYAIVARHDDRA